MAFSTGEVGVTIWYLNIYNRSDVKDEIVERDCMTSDAEQKKARQSCGTTNEIFKSRRMQECRCYHLSFQDFLETLERISLSLEQVGFISAIQEHSITNNKYSVIVLLR